MKDEKYLIFETDFWEVLLSNDQRYLGRCVIFSKRECDSLAGLTAEEGIDFFKIVKKLEELFKRTFNATMFNWACLMNDYYKTVPRKKPCVHWHLRPRYDHTVTFAGQIFKDPNFGYHYLRVPEDQMIVSREILNQITDELKRNL